MNSPPPLLFKSGTFVNFVRQIGRHLQRKAKVAEVPHALPSAGTFLPSIIEINGSLRAEMQSSGRLSANSWRFFGGFFGEGGGDFESLTGTES